MNREFHPVGPGCAYEVFREALDILGATDLERIFQRGRSQVYRYAEKPGLSANDQGNPLTRLRALLRRLVEFGGERGRDCALAALALLAEAAPGARVVLDDAETPEDLDRVQAALDAHDALARLIGVARAGVHPHLIEMETARSEQALRRFGRAYARDFAQRDGDARFAAANAPENLVVVEFVNRVTRPWWRRWFGRGK